MSRITRPSTVRCVVLRRGTHVERTCTATSGSVSNGPAAAAKRKAAASMHTRGNHASDRAERASPHEPASRAQLAAGADTLTSNVVGAPIALACVCKSASAASSAMRATPASGARCEANLSAKRIYQRS